MRRAPGLTNAASSKQWSRLLKKRDLIAYFLLCREPRKWNIGEALEYLVENMYVSHKVAHSIVRRLIRMQLLSRVGEVDLECIGFMEYIKGLARSYIASRSRRVRR